PPKAEAPPPAAAEPPAPVETVTPSMPAALSFAFTSTDLPTDAPAVPTEHTAAPPAAVDQAPPTPLPAEPAKPPAPVLPSLDHLPEPPPELAYVVVNEAGASDYSTSPLGREEFPGFDATLRSTISIGRRLQDPLSELVKIDPQHVGVGLYQHDVSPKQLRESLDGVVESCVNQVGVDLNTASVPLLRHVSGLNQ